MECDGGAVKPPTAVVRLVNGSRGMYANTRNIGAECDCIRTYMEVSYVCIHTYIQKRGNVCMHTHMFWWFEVNMHTYVHVREVCTLTNKHVRMQGIYAYTCACKRGIRQSVFACTHRYFAPPLKQVRIDACHASLTRRSTCIQT